MDPSVPFPQPRHWVIGDIHGCHSCMVALLDVLPKKDHLIFCGDVINGGPQIEACMTLAWDLMRCGQATWLRGNHEQRLIEALALEDVTPEEIETDAPLFVDGLGLDSIDALELAMALEERYGVAIDDDPERNQEIFASVRSLVAFVVEQREGA